ncbi:hypothetical protein ACIBG8_06320 [Nonomuraea sp. NPDC050556]|uniref:hypothetical protein n=1 Tax=Nonomuraea sp. NPDC050556 TaxID=3364369 RepID=UPI00379AF42E
MAARRNPKKDKSARRRRPERRPASSGRRVRMGMETVTTLMLNAEAEALPLIGVAAVWLWNVAEDGEGAAYCVDGCLTLHYALAEFGIASRVEAVILEMEGNGSHTLYGGDGPSYNANGTFNGHAVLVVPDAHRFLDPTLQQYAEVPETEEATGPLMARLPAGVSLGTAVLEVARSGHRVRYHPVPEHLREAWRNPAITANEAAYRQAGANLAANVFDMLRTEFFRDKILAAPYPRLHRLLQALGEAKSSADGNGYRFRPAGAASDVRLADIR